MKFLLTIVVLFVCACSSFAEVRGITVLITHVEANNGFVASIRSDEPTEQKQNISLVDAAEILGRAKSWGSMVKVRIVSDSLLDTQALLPILQAMSRNPFLQLNYLLNGSSPEPREVFLKNFQ